MKCKKLAGDNIAPKNKAAAEKLIGKQVEYLCYSDDTPKRGVVTGATGREVVIDHRIYLQRYSVVEMRVLR